MRRTHMHSASVALAVALAGLATSARMGDAPPPVVPKEPEAPPDPLRTVHGYVEGKGYWFQIIYKDRVLEHVSAHPDQFAAGQHCERLLTKWRKEPNLDAAAKNKARVRPPCAQCGGGVRGRGTTIGNDTFCRTCKP